MKAIWFSLVVLVIAGLNGCDSKGTSGGPGAPNNNSDNKPLGGQADDSFKLKPPGTTKLKQGESMNASIGIHRGKNFGQDVKLKFEDLPKGVSIEPSSPEIKHGDEEAKITIKAADDAAVGEFTFKVMGHPAKGPDAVEEIKLKVEKK